MTRDEIIKTARELDMIDFRDHDGDEHVAQFVDFLVVLVGKAEATLAGKLKGGADCKNGFAAGISVMKVIEEVKGEK